LYLGDSLERKNCGPTIFPTQYAINTSELTVLLFVNPATFDVIKLREMEIFIANTQAKTRPVMRPF
jgi:hypothetical protein